MIDPRLIPIEAYVRQQAGLSALKAQLEAPSALFSRRTLPGHITASGLLLTPDHREVLLIHHRGLDKWLQPGGHVDEDDAAVWQTARREIGEETGITKLTLHPWHAEHAYQPIDIDTHAIPARPEKGEGEHWHHDCLYVFVAAKSPITPQAEEVSGACWCAIDDARVQGRLRRVLSLFSKEHA